MSVPSKSGGQTCEWSVLCSVVTAEWRASDLSRDGVSPVTYFNLVLIESASDMVPHVAKYQQRA